MTSRIIAMRPIEFLKKFSIPVVLGVFSIVSGFIFLEYLHADAINATDFVITVKTDNAGTSNSTSFTIPTTGTGYNYSVDWNNDGVMDQSGITGNVTHDFGSAGTKTIRIAGAFPRIYFNNAGDKSKLLQINQWGTNAWASMGNAFYGCNNLTVPATDVPNLAGVTDMSYMFRTATSLSTNAAMNTWNTSSIINMSGVFLGASAFNQDISGWNTGNVTNMTGMFESATVFNQNIGGWNTSKVTNMAGMFQLASAFNQNIGAWDTSKVTSMANMFNAASAFNNGGSATINNWDTSNVTSMFWLFRASSFNQPVGTWNTAKVTNMAGMFMTNAFNQNVSNWNTSNVTDMNYMFYGASTFNQPIVFNDNGTPGDITDDKWNTAKVTNMSFMFYGNTAFNQNIGGWNTGNVLNMASMFQNATAFNGNIGSWDVSKVTNMSNMFKAAPVFTQNIGSWNTGAVTNMSWMFDGATAFNNGGSSSIGTWNTSNVTLMYAMFRSSAFNQNIGSWDTSKVTDMAQMFYGAPVFNNGGNASIGNWNTAAVTTMQGMFSNNNVFNQPIGNWNTGNVVNMANMFHVSNNFNQPIGNWNTAKVTNMQEMFRYAVSFNQNISNWNTALVTNMQGMFSYTSAFNQPIGNWNTAAVTTMNYMFQNATAFNQNIGNWNIGNVTNVTNMFLAATLSINNYDATLAGWIGGGKTVRPSLAFHGGNAKYCSTTARTTLTTAPNSWTITDAGQNCTTISVTATTPYNTGISQSISFAYSATTSTGTTQCRLLDYNQVPLTAYATNNPIAYTSPSAAGQYTYYVQCRNTTYPTANTLSNAIQVNVFSCANVIDVPAAECDALMNIYNSTGGPSWTRKTGWGTDTTVANWEGVTVTGGYVTELNLSDNNLSGTVALAQGTLAHLTTMDLSWNSLTAFSGIGLTALQSLYLHHNSISSFTPTSLSSLNWLDLGTNSLDSFNSIGLFSLQYLNLGSNDFVSFDGSALFSLVELRLDDNVLTGTFSGAGLSSLERLHLSNNALTGFTVGDLTALQILDLDANQINSFDTTGLTSLQVLGLWNNNLVSFDATGLSSIWNLNLKDNDLVSFTGSANLSSINSLDLSGNQLTSFNATGLSSLGVVLLDNNHIRSLFSIDTLESLWGFSIGNNCLVREALDPSVSSWLDINSVWDDWTSQSATCPPVPPICTEVTDVPAAECEALMDIYTGTNGTNWAIKTRWGLSPTVDSWYGVTVSGGHVTELDLSANNLTGSVAIAQGNLDHLVNLVLHWNGLTSFSGNGLSAVTTLYLEENDLTSFDGTGLESVQIIHLETNQLPSFDGTGLSGLTELYLASNQLTSVEGLEGLSALTKLGLYGNQLPSFSGVGLSNLTELTLGHNLLTSFNAAGLSGLTQLYIEDNLLTSFNAAGLSGLGYLSLHNNLLTSFSGNGLVSLTGLSLYNNLLTSFNGVGLSSLQTLLLDNNRISSLANMGGISAFFITMGNNCLVSQGQTTEMNNWLNANIDDDWTSRGASCPALAQTMYFCGTYLTDPDNWNQATNWKSDAACLTASLKSRPDAADNAIVLSSVGENTGSLATVRTLQVKNSAAISIPLINNGSDLKMTTTLAGDNNDITWTAANPYVSIEYAEPADVAETMVMVEVTPPVIPPGDNPVIPPTTYKITITPGTKARMQKGLGAIPRYFYLQNTNGRPEYRDYEYSGDHIWYEYNNDAELWNWVSDIDATRSYAFSEALYPDGLQFVDNGGNPVTEFTSAVSSASQVIAAVAANPMAAALISGTLAPSDNPVTEIAGTGAVTAMSEKSISTQSDTYSVPMSFFDTSSNAIGNTLTGNANFDCTAQNLGIVTGTSTFTQCPTPNPNTAPAMTPQTWYDRTWGYRTKVTIDHTKVANTDQLSFPVLISRTDINWKTVANGGHVEQTDGGDFVFVSASGVKLDHEIEKYVPTTGELIAWVEVPTVSAAADTDVYVYYGNASVADQWNKTGVWDSNYKGVWHLPNGTALTALDSTSNALNGTPTGANTLPVAGKINGGASVSGGGYIETGLQTMGSTNVTIEIWAHANNFTQNAILVNKEPVNQRWLLFLEGGFLKLRGGGTSSTLTTSLPSNAAWHHLVATINGTTGKIYKDGVEAASGTVNAATDASTRIEMGRFVNSYFFNGSMDEVRVSNTVRSADWIATEYNNQSSPTTFSTAASEETPPTMNSVTTPIFSGPCLTNTLVTLYHTPLAGSPVALLPSVTCTNGTYTIVPTLEPGDYSITACQSNRKGPSFGKSNPCSAALETTIGCPAGFEWNGIVCSSACTATEVPSELKANVDKPFIDCTGDGVGGHTHFKYKISNPGDISFAPVESGIFPVDGTERIMHPTSLPASDTDYKVECIYGDAAMSAPVTDTSCIKNMLVRVSTVDNEVQGCARIGNNFENFVGYEKWVHNTGFNASVSCFARKSDPEVAVGISPFALQYNSGAFLSLDYLNSFLDIGRFASEINIHTFDSSTSTSVTCAVRVGDGYSTNSACQNIGCGGEDCDAPSQYLIQPTAANLYCTKEATAKYTIGCAPGDGYSTCIDPQTNNVDSQNLYHGLVLQTGGEYDGKYTKTLKFRINGDVTSSETNVVMACSLETPQTPETITPSCTITLPTGKELAYRISTQPVTPVDIFQVMYDPVPQDIDAPMATITGSAAGIVFSDDTRTLTSVGSEWINKPVTATIRCTNSPVENNDSCTCAWLVKADTTGNVDNTDWGLVTPLKDIVDYQRIIRNETLQNQEFFIFDNVGNMDPDKSKVSITLGVDTLLPSISGTVVSSSNPEANRIKLTATDNTGGSGLWGHGIRTAVVDEGANINTIFNGSCNVVGISASHSPDITSIFYAPFPETGFGVGPLYSSEITYNTGTQKIVYCVQDNAKNRLVGTYPFDPNLLIGCFSDGSQQFVPNLNSADNDKYYAGTNPLSLLQRLMPPSPKYGYEFTDSDKAISTNDFRTKLAQNIEMLVRQQYCPTHSFLSSVINLEEKDTLDHAARVRQINPLTNTRIECSEADASNTGPRNTKGYYYFEGNGSGGVVDVAGVARLTGTKVLIVEGADIYLRGDIHYFSRASSLVIVAIKKDGFGGNVYVNPSVTSIDATIIADGALMNGTYTTQEGLIPKVWFNDIAGELKNPLVINGRLLTHNSRGGSLVANGNNLESIPTTEGNVTGKCFDNTALNPSCLNTTAALQDLERFRVVMQVPDDQSNRCTLHVTGVMALNRPEILTRTGF